MNIQRIGIIFIILLVLAFLYTRFFGPLESLQTLYTQPPVTSTQLSEDVSYTIQSVATNLKVPWSVVFTSKTRALISERSGSIRVLENDVLSPTPLHTFSNVSSKSEEGLMGLAVDPNYETTKYIYACYATMDGSTMSDKVVRLTDEGTRFTNETVILAGIPAAVNHAGCRLRFGPDQKLYITTGEATQKNIAQDRNSLGGKILRINADGSIPQDNPFPNSPVFSLGHRNPQGIDWHPLTNQLWETEHGPSGNDGPGGGDEVNKIEAGKNYGWPIVSHQKSAPEFVSPSLVFTPAIAPASGMFYRGSVYPQWKNNFLFGMLRGTGIMRVQFDDQGEKIVSNAKIDNIDVGRVREIVESPDGILYFTTSNQDGRGRARPQDDQLFKIIVTQ
ncbi:PQQ-dependent sugar dehydrogenase [Candidatus Woesebacteria bacterium]|nr:PQQ-dependent sugar dehydrogenase [Candidatus Woesebacteria bacterium]